MGISGRITAEEDRVVTGDREWKPAFHRFSGKEQREGVRQLVGDASSWVQTRGHEDRVAHEERDKKPGWGTRWSGEKQSQSPGGEAGVGGELLIIREEAPCPSPSR